MFLTVEELAALTGYKMAAGHARWLEARGWRFERTRGGAVVVLRSYAETMLGSGPGRAAEPRFDRIPKVSGGA